MSLQILILAAGEARRFGGPKQLANVNGEPMLQRVLSRACAVAGHAVTVVLGAHARDILQVLRSGPATVVINRDWAEGVASSIRAGMQSACAAYEGVMILLGDQPLIGTETLQALIGAWRRQPRCLIASQYGAVTGVPAIFPRWCYADLLGLRGDQGARLLLRRYADSLIRVPNPQAAVDVDQPEDLRRLDARL